jgi:hypothetical protein
MDIDAIMVAEARNRHRGALPTLLRLVDRQVVLNTSQTSSNASLRAVLCDSSCFYTGFVSQTILYPQHTSHHHGQPTARLSKLATKLPPHHPPLLPRIPPV